MGHVPPVYGRDELALPSVRPPPTAVTCVGTLGLVSSPVLYAKVETQGLTGSVYDRMGRALVDAHRAVSSAAIVEAGHPELAVAVAYWAGALGVKSKSYLSADTPEEFFAAILHTGGQVVKTAAALGADGALAAASGVAHVLYRREVDSAMLALVAELDEQIRAAPAARRLFVLPAVWDGLANAAVARMAAMGNFGSVIVAAGVARGGEGARSIPGLGDGAAPIPGVQLIHVGATEAREMRLRVARHGGVLVGYATAACVVAGLEVAVQRDDIEEIWFIASESGERYFSYDRAPPVASP